MDQFDSRNTIRTLVSEPLPQVLYGTKRNFPPPLVAIKLRLVNGNRWKSPIKYLFPSLSPLANYHADRANRDQSVGLSVSQRYAIAHFGIRNQPFIRPLTHFGRLLGSWNEPSCHICREPLSFGPPVVLDNSPIFHLMQFIRTTHSHPSTLEISEEEDARSVRSSRLQQGITVIRTKRRIFSSPSRIKISIFFTPMPDV